jgi:hypothetical protein
MMYLMVHEMNQQHQHQQKSNNTQQQQQQQQQHSIAANNLLSSAFNLFKARNNNKLQTTTSMASQIIPHLPAPPDDYSPINEDESDDNESSTIADDTVVLSGGGGCGGNGGNGKLMHHNFYHPMQLNNHNHHFQQQQIQLPNLKSKYFESPITQSQIQYDCSAPIARNTPENNQVRIIDYRANKIASFRVDGKELICLPQAFEVFLKNLVGGLHTVYTKLKRLDIVPVVCNVEQVDWPLCLHKKKMLPMGYERISFVCLLI